MELAGWKFLFTVISSVHNYGPQCDFLYSGEDVQISRE